MVIFVFILIYCMSADLGIGLAYHAGSDFGMYTQSRNHLMALRPGLPDELVPEETFTRSHP